MSLSDNMAPTEQVINPLQSAFLAILPVVRGVAGAYFRDVRCPDRKEDLVCEAVALAWAWFVRLRERGREPNRFVVTLARLAARAAACGRRLAGQDRTNDVLSPTCRRRHEFTLVAFAAGTPEPGTPLADALADNTKSPVPAQVQFRCDFPVWHARLDDKKRFVANQLVIGHRPGDVARAVGLTPARISQMRGELRRDYLQFLADTTGK